MEQFLDNHLVLGDSIIADQLKGMQIPNGMEISNDFVLDLAELESYADEDSFHPNTTISPDVERIVKELQYLSEKFLLPTEMAFLADSYKLDLIERTLSTTTLEELFMSLQLLMSASIIRHCVNNGTLPNIIDGANLTISIQYRFDRNDIGGDYKLDYLGISYEPANFDYSRDWPTDIDEISGEEDDDDDPELPYFELV